LPFVLCGRCIFRVGLAIADPRIGEVRTSNRASPVLSFQNKLWPRGGTMMHVCRSGRHVIRGPGDKRSNGSCRGCALESEARYRASLRDARDKLRKLESLLAV